MLRFDVDEPLIKPPVLETVPLRVSVFPLISSVPVVWVNAPLMVKSEPKVAEPVVRFKVRLLSVRAPVVKFIVPKAPEPPILRLLLLLPVIVPAPEMVLFSVTVFAPIVNGTLALMLRGWFMVKSVFAPNETPAVLLKVR